MLLVKNAYKSITMPHGERLNILNAVSLEIAPGESVGILGRSGSGKSTLLALLGLLDDFDSGSYLIDGTETTLLSDRQKAKLRKATFGFIYQRFCLMNHFNVYQNVEAPLQHFRRSKAERQQAVIKSLTQVGLLERINHKPYQLSGGEQQRVAIARALAHKPKVILADEPTGSLDVKTGDAVLRLLHTLVKLNKVSLVLVTHDKEIAKKMDKVLELKAGNLIHKKI